MFDEIMDVNILIMYKGLSIKILFLLMYLLKGLIFRMLYVVNVI